MLQKGPFSRLMVLILVIGFFATAGYAAHDLTCYEIIEPSGDYLEADSAIIPKLGIANLGDEAEFDFPVEFLVIDKEGLLGYENDTVFAETTRVAYIGPYPDSIEVELPEWAPEGRCCDVGWRGGPFVYYDLFGIVAFETDEERANDTVRDSVTCLLSHDVGVTDIVIDKEPDTPPDYYNPGTPINITATVENFGYNMEHDVPVRCEITDEDADTLIYNNVQVISALDWRGNPYDNPYTVDITFPTWTTPSDNRFCIECRTEMEGDLCPDDDFENTATNTGIGETPPGLPFALEAITPNPFVSSTTIFFTVPYTTDVSLKVYDITGKLVTTLINCNQTPGRHNVEWNGTDDAGRSVAQGIYLIRMQADEFNAVRKVVIMN